LSAVHRQAEALIMSAVVPSRGRGAIRLSALGEADVDWMATMRWANDEFVGPALWSALTALSLEDRVPLDARDYLALLHSENARCNRLMREQCEAIGAALAAVGTTAVLLKGAAFLFEDGPASDDRMLRDIDVLIDDRRQDSVRIALRAIGYRDADNMGADPGHVHDRPMVHPQALGIIEVHREISTRPQMLSAEDVLAKARLVAPGLAVPSTEQRIAHNVVHSEVINGGYVGHVVGLRDGLDLARLIDRGVDWERLDATARARGYYRQLSAALHKAARFAGAALGSPFADDPGGRRYASWCVLQRRLPLIDAGMRKLGVLHRALAWERDAYALGLGSDRSLYAHVEVNKRRWQRTWAALTKAFRGALADDSEAL
jgi:hypothetical protein